MFISWIKKYILPKEVDFINAMYKHSKVINKIADSLYNCTLQKRCKDFEMHFKLSKEIYDKNMKELLNVFITPIDRESIYRVITQLDWTALSIYHFYLEAKAYDIEFDKSYKDIISKIKLQAELLTAGFKTIKTHPNKTDESAKKVRKLYEEISQIYIEKMVELSNSNDIKAMFEHKSLLHQLKDISRHLRMSANSLEDIIMKMV